MQPSLLAIPIPVLAVQLAGLVQSVYLLRKKPWSKEWSVPRFAGSPQLLLAFRVAALLYIVSISTLQILDRGLKVFAFYTVWNWTLLGCYFALAITASYLSLRKRRANPRRHVSWLEHAVVVLFHVNLTTVLIVDVLTWTVLWPMLRANPDAKAVDAFRRLFFNYISYSQHGFNAVLMLVELLLNNIQFLPYMLGYVGLWSSIYGCWAMFHYLNTGRWMYPFLDATKPWAPVAYLGLFATHWVFFGVVWLLYKLKTRFWDCVKAAEKQA